MQFHLSSVVANNFSRRPQFFMGDFSFNKIMDAIVWGESEKSKFLMLITSVRVKIQLNL